MSPLNKYIHKQSQSSGFMLPVETRDSPTPSRPWSLKKHSPPGWPSRPPAGARTARRSSGACSPTPWTVPCRRWRPSGKTGVWASAAAPTPPAAAPAGRAGGDGEAVRGVCSTHSKHRAGTARAAGGGGDWAPLVHGTNILESGSSARKL